MPASPDKINVAYIAGYGRSGSTLLERILSSHNGAVGLGEIAYLANTELSDFYWDAAEGIPLWDELAPELRFSEDEVARRETVQTRYESRLTGWFYWLFRMPNAEYRKHTLSVLNAIQGAVPATTTWLVDSSKTARDRFFRPFMFRRLPEVNTCMIHLVRDPRGSVQSVRRGSNAAMERGANGRYKLAVLRAAYGWTMANLSGLLFRAIYGPDNYVRLRYEELAGDPVTCLKRLEPMLGLNFSTTVERIQSGKPLAGGDQFAGNRMRLESVIKLKTDERWRTDMPKSLQWLVTILCLPVSLFVLRKQGPVSDETPEYKSAA